MLRSNLATLVADNCREQPPSMSFTSCSWMRTRVFWRVSTMCQRRSTSSPSSCGVPSGTTGRRTLARRPAIAVERASWASVLCPEPDSLRTSADSLGGTSRTCSPASTSCRDSSQPRPLAFSIAHNRSGQRPAHASSRSTCRRSATTRSWSSCSSSSSSATAVCDRLWGSTPMMTVMMAPPAVVGRSPPADKPHASLLRIPVSSHAGGRPRRATDHFQARPPKRPAGGSGVSSSRPSTLWMPPLRRVSITP